MRDRVFQHKCQNQKHQKYPISHVMGVEAKPLYLLPGLASQYVADSKLCHCSTGTLAYGTF